MQTQGLTAKEFKSKDSKSKELQLANEQSALPHIDFNKPAKLSR